MSTSQPIKDQKSILNEKKPRFVPYEPYKAAVTPLVPLKKKGSRGSMKAQSPIYVIEDGITILNSDVHSRKAI